MIPAVFGLCNDCARPGKFVIDGWYHMNKRWWYWAYYACQWHRAINTKRKRRGDA
jgi:hypothetical protein